MAEYVFSGELKDCKGVKQDTAKFSRVSLLGPTIDETIIYLICVISMNLASKLNIVHKDSGQKQNFRKREAIGCYYRKYYKGHHSSECASRKSISSVSI